MVETSFNVTSSTRTVALEIVKELGTKYKTFQTAMVKFWLEGDHKIAPRLEITSYTDPEYVRKDYREHILLEDEDNEMIEYYAEKLGVTKSIILFQAMIDFTIYWTGRLWTREEYTEKFKYTERD